MQELDKDKDKENSSETSSNSFVLSNSNVLGK